MQLVEETGSLDPKSKTQQTRSNLSVSESMTSMFPLSESLLYQKADSHLQGKEALC